MEKSGRPAVDRDAIRAMQSQPEMASNSSFPVFRCPDQEPKSRLERLLAPIADVRAGEGPGVVLLTLTVFLLLGAYYMLKTARESLILTEGSAEIKTYSSAGQALLLILLVPLYGMVASKVNRAKLITGLILFFVTHLAIFYVLGMSGVREGVVYFIWVGIFNVFVISQVWAFANDLYTEPQGKRLFPVIGIGSSIGAWVGAQAATQVVRNFNPYSLMLGAAMILLICVVLLRWVNSIESRRAAPEWGRLSAQPLAGVGAFHLISGSRYLMLIAGLTVLLNVVNSCGEYLLSKLVVQEAAAQFTDAAARQRFIGEFYGTFFGWVNLLGALLQIFAVSRIFHHVGVRGALFVLPCIALVSYSVLAVAPILLVVTISKILENSTDYSIQNSTRQALYLPTSREAKYKAKAAIDTFFMRAGDVLQAGVVRLGTTAGAGIASFAWLNVVLTLGWLAVAAGLYRQHKLLTSAAARVPVTDAAAAVSKPGV